MEPNNTSNLGQREHGSFHIPQTPELEPHRQIQFNITYPDPLLGKSYSSVEVSSTYSRVPVDRVHKYQTVQFEPEIGPYEVLPFSARVDLGAFSTTLALLKPRHQIV